MNAMKKAQKAIRSKLEKLPRISGTIGKLHTAVVPVGRNGWVHGRRGILIAPTRMRCIETEEEFDILYCIK